MAKSSEIANNSSISLRFVTNCVIKNVKHVDEKTPVHIGLRIKALLTFASLEMIRVFSPVSLPNLHHWLSSPRTLRRGVIQHNLKSKIIKWSRVHNKNVLSNSFKSTPARSLSHSCYIGFLAEIISQ